MRTVYDVLPVDFTCACGQELFELAGRLKKVPQVTCSSCNTLIALSDRELQENFDRVRAEFMELTSSMRSLGAFALQ